MQINRINYNTYQIKTHLNALNRISFKRKNTIPKMFLNIDFDNFIKEQQQIKINKELAKLEEEIEINDYDPTRLRSKLDKQYNRLSLEDKKEYHRYYKSINFKEISKIEPKINDYSETAKRLFAMFHFLKAKNANPFEAVKKPRFTKKDLTYSEDLTQDLKNRFINGTEMEDILLTYPATERTVGELPEDLKSNDNEDKSRLQKVSDEISDFAIEQNTKVLEKRLENIFGKEFKVSDIGSGSYGTCYKIEAENTQPLCLKIYKRTPINNCDNVFGKCVEPQIGIYGNEHSNELVKMFFGKVASEKDIDGFIVTQFLDNTTKPIDTKQSSSKEIIVHDVDKRLSNIINHKIIDYGGIIFEE